MSPVKVRSGIHGPRFAEGGIGDSVGAEGLLERLILGGCDNINDSVHMRYRPDVRVHVPITGEEGSDGQLPGQPE